MAGYVHVVILIIFNVLFVNVIGEDDIRYVAFVIDETSSMADDIDGVKSQTHQVFDAILKSDVTKFDKFALVTFNDPSPGEVRIITDDPNAFKRSLDSINVDGGGDCPELAMHGILNALNACPSNSVIYVFTDAAAKDYYKFEEIKSLSLKKSIQVTFLLTGICDAKGLTNENFLVYHKIAEATSGQVFLLSKSNISKAIEFITQSIASERHLIGQTTSKCPLDVNFKVDDKTGNILISASKFLEIVPKIDDKMTLKVFDADNNEVESYSMLDLQFMNVLHIRNPKPGYYKAKLDCHDRLRTRLTVTGSTSISFMHGFSKDEPSSMKETTALPVPGEESFLSIILDNPTKDVRLNTVELIDVDSNVIGKPITLKLVNAKQQLYTTTAKIVLPDKMFKIKVNGYNMITGVGISRVGVTFIEPQKVFGKIENKSPTVKIIGDTEIITESNKPVTIKCDVQAYPKPEIIWVSDDGEEFHPEIITVDVTGQFKSILQVGESNKNAMYYCRAKNSMGGDEAHAKITRIEEPPSIKYAGNEVQRLEKAMVEIPCSIIKGNPTPHVEWLKNSNVINDGSKYQILEDHTLRFQADQSDNDAYFTCVAKNRIGSSKRNFHVTVYTKPEIKDLEKGNIINITVNEAIDLQCIAKGNPLPEIQWLNTTNKIITFDYRNRDHTRSKATINDGGNYTCVATNAWGIDKKTFQVKVHVPVRVIMPESTTITVPVGSSLNLPCSASGYPEPTAKIIYFSKDYKSPKVLKEGKSGEKVILEAYYAEQKNSGYYVCSASNGYSSSNFTYTVNIEAPPFIIDKWMNYICAVEGDLLVRIPCKVQGNPKPIVTWKLGDHPLTNKVAHQILDDGTLVLLKPYTSLSGDYICEAKSPTGNDNKIVTVYIRAYPEGPGEEELIPKTWVVEKTPSLIPCNIPHSDKDLVRWFKDEKEIQIGELNIDKPSMRDNGLYTCRVSNTTTSISYHTKVVVGFRPRFINADPTEPIEYIRGSDTLLDCSAQAEPLPKVKWTLNDYKIVVPSMAYKITNMKTEDIGVYKCTVFNSFGEITRKYRIKSGECQLSISHDSIAFQPLILTETERWPVLEIQKGSMIVPHEKPLMLYCPESSFNYPGLETVEKVKAVCISDSTFAIRGEEIKFSDLKCQTEITVYAVPQKVGDKHVQCLPNRKKWYSQLYTIGYKYEGRIKGLYDICFDTEDSVPVFSRYSFVASVSNEGLKEELPFVNSGVDLPHDFSQLYDPSRQIRIFSHLLGKEFESNSCHFRKKQLVISQDILPGLLQTATFHYLNMMPHWSLCYQQNWEEVESKVRKFASSLKFSVYIWTGTYGRMRFPGQTIDSDVHLSDDSDNKQYVPLYLWKVIQTYTDGMVAIIQINLPNLSDTEATKYVKCPDICHEISWLRSEEWHNVKRGYIFCCNIDEFEGKFHFKGMFQGQRNVLGTSPW
ncbi:hemicentin-1-like [Aricia agestis]|uniref:hemicentin-1-like n=1 Tax=Aricia agestis TaxID=91739 RepID=UPI001C207CAF|nr:hemicentin-1-like [Aricia agestis]